MTKTTKTKKKTDEKKTCFFLEVASVGFVIDVTHRNASHFKTTRNVVVGHRHRRRRCRDCGVTERTPNWIVVDRAQHKHHGYNSTYVNTTITFGIGSG